MVVTVVEIVTDASDEHDEKASRPIVITPVGIVTDVNDVHNVKA